MPRHRPDPLFPRDRVLTTLLVVAVLWVGALVSVALVAAACEAPAQVHPVELASPTVVQVPGPAVEVSAAPTEAVKPVVAHPVAKAKHVVKKAGKHAKVKKAKASKHKKAKHKHKKRHKKHRQGCH